MPHKILAIDDHRQTLEIVLITLQQNGYVAVGSSSPRQAIPLAEQEKPDLILLDMNMPQVDGKEICRRLRSHPQFSEIPIIMFSAEATEKLASFQVGADDFLVKPADPEVLIDRIEALLRGSSRIVDDSTKASPPAEKTPSSSPGKELSVEEPPSSAALEPNSGDHRLIAVIGVRGGSGTTTMATNLAVAAAQIGYDTALVDFDLVQGHVGLHLKAKPSENNISELVRLPDDRLSHEWPKLLVRYNKRLHLILAKPNFAGRYPVPSPKQAAIITAALKRFSRCVVVDLGHEITDVGRAVLDGADQVIVCVPPERIALLIARPFLRHLSAGLYPHSSLHTIVINTVTGLNLPKKSVESFLGHPLLAMIPAQPKGMLLAMNKGMPFVELYPKAKLTKMFHALAKHLVEAKMNVKQP